MSNARERLALRNMLQDHLHPAEIRAVHWPTVIREAEPAIARGWTGHELARWCIGDLSSDVDNAGAVIVTTLRGLAQTDPPRDTTPAPADVETIRRERAKAVREAAGVDHSAWVERIRGQHAARRRENAR